MGKKDSSLRGVKGCLLCMNNMFIVWFFCISFFVCATNNAEKIIPFTRILNLIQLPLAPYRSWGSYLKIGWRMFNISANHHGWCCKPQTLWFQASTKLLPCKHASSDPTKKGADAEGPKLAGAPRHLNLQSSHWSQSRHFLIRFSLLLFPIDYELALVGSSQWTKLATNSIDILFLSGFSWSSSSSAENQRLWSVRICSGKASMEYLDADSVNIFQPCQQSWVVHW